MRFLGILFLSLFLIFPNLLLANHLEHTKMEVMIFNTSEPISVSISHTIHIDSNEQKIPLRVIGKSIAHIQKVKVRLEGQEYALNLNPINFKMSQGEIYLPAARVQSGQIKLEISYELNASTFDGKQKVVSIPILFVDWKPESAKAKAFVASIKADTRFALKSRFPAMKWKKESEENLNVYSFDLQVIPSWVKFKLYEGKLPLISLELLVDLGVIFVLLSLMFFGWKKYLA